MRKFPTFFLKHAQQSEKTQNQAKRPILSELLKCQELYDKKKKSSYGGSFVRLFGYIGIAAVTFVFRPSNAYAGDSQPFSNQQTTADVRFTNRTSTQAGPSTGGQVVNQMNTSPFYAGEISTQGGQAGPSTGGQEAAKKESNSKARVDALTSLSKCQNSFFKVKADANWAASQAKKTAAALLDPNTADTEKGHAAAAAIAAALEADALATKATNAASDVDAARAAARALGAKQPVTEHDIKIFTEAACRMLKSTNPKQQALVAKCLAAAHNPPSLGGRASRFYLGRHFPVGESFVQVFENVIGQVALASEANNQNSEANNQNSKS